MQSAIGALQFLTLTPADIHYAASQLARFSSNPGPAQAADLKAFLRYLATNPSMNIHPTTQSMVDWTFIVSLTKITLGTNPTENRPLDL